MNTARLTFQLEKQGLSLPGKITKRDGAKVDFDISRIERAVEKCYAELSEVPTSSVREVVESCAVVISSRYGPDKVPTVEQIQDLVEVSLLTHNAVTAAKAYMNYRDSHAKMRGEDIPEHVRETFEIDAGYFPTPMQRFAFYDKYSRYNWELNRRETWPETVDRTIDHLKWEVYYHVVQENAKKENAVFTGYKSISATDLTAAQYSEFSQMPISDEIWERLRKGILEMRIMPSMRLLAMAGPAIRRNSVSIFNCAFYPVSDIDAFVESLIISMSGCGDGYSVERLNVEKFPRVARQDKSVPESFVVEDSSEGWASALRAGLNAWWSGKDLTFDFSLIRPAGSVLKTKGGRASGPAPLKEMLENMRRIILSRQGTFIRTIDAHDLNCWSGEAAVQGSTRRTAKIALFDIDDVAMRTCKSDPGFWNDPHMKVRQNANNSAVWPEDVTDVQIMRQMTEMVMGCSGEPGIFSRAAAENTMPAKRRENNPGVAWGTNPCAEIILKPYEFCNLSQAISRPGDTESDLAEKVELATILGTLQSLSTRFPGLRPEWKKNCEEERLLGVDLTAQNDCELLWATNSDGAGLRRRLQAHAVAVNALYAGILGINPSASITCNKPAGNSTGFIGASGSGIHRAQFAFGIRRMTVGAHTPQFRVLRDSGAPMQPYAGYGASADRWWVEFPLKAPESAPLLRDATAIEQLEFWLLNKLNWTSHNPSATISYRVHEVVDIIKWLCVNKKVIGGLSFLPQDDAIYPIMPFEETTEEEYERRVAAFPAVDYSLLYQYERSDMSEASTTLSCFAGNCEI